MAGKESSPGRAPEGIKVNDDGTVLIQWDAHDVLLRRPTIEQWLSYLEEGERADEWRAQPGHTIRDLIGDDCPYRHLHARILLELAGETVAVSDLPVWMSDGGLLTRLSGTWLSVPLLSSAGTMGTVRP